MKEVLADVAMFSLSNVVVIVYLAMIVISYFIFVRPLMKLECDGDNKIARLDRSQLHSFYTLMCLLWPITVIVVISAFICKGIDEEQN